MVSIRLYSKDQQPIATYSQYTHVSIPLGKVCITTYAFCISGNNIMIEVGDSRFGGTCYKIRNDFIGIGIDKFIFFGDDAAVPKTRRIRRTLRPFPLPFSLTEMHRRAQNKTQRHKAATC